VHHNEVSLRASARDLADPTHSRRSLRASVERRARLARRRRMSAGGRRTLIAAASALALGAGGAAAHESGGVQAGSSAKASAKTRTAAATLVAVQRELGIVADGVMGPQTRRAIKRFQRRNGLTVDGVPGPATLAALGVTPSSASAAGASVKPSSQLARIAQCESGGDPTAVSPDGRYRGKYQFSRSTWKSLGGKGDPAAAPEAEQDRLAALLMERQGPSAWPVCSKQAA
jgi:peptidoglycan hydrolase-like protein with peptidoglycan-binding domain